MEAEAAKRDQSLSQLVETFRCCVCLGFLRPGQKLRCCTPNGHLVCSACYTDMKKLSTDKEGPSCPLCRVGKYDEAASFVTLKAIFDIAKNFITYDCQGVSFGCFKKFSASELLVHEARCPQALSNCPGQGCNYKAPLSYLRAHNTELRAKCFTEIGYARNCSSFFVWKIEIGGRELLDAEGRVFCKGDRSFKPALLRSQDPAVKLCLLTGLTEERNFFTANVVLLKDNCFPKAIRQENRCVKFSAQACHCNSLTFTGEAVYQNCDGSEMEAEGRQLRIHSSTFLSLVRKCLLCKSNVNPKLLLRVELIFNVR